MKKAVVAMSGGVDSSVTAALMKDEGYDVTGIMLKLWKGGEENTDSGCCSVGAADDARRVADVLDIPFYVFNFADRFEETVIADFERTYAAGQTPNPCVRCNQWIKFDLLLDRAKQLGADVLATGHYAQVVESDGRYSLRRGADPRKDQSYVLWMLTQSQLAHVRFPVGSMHKTETRARAEQLGLRTANKPDSQEICFVRSGDVGNYMSERVPDAAQRGPLVDTSGKVLGEHQGLGNYTVGQRKGLGIALGEPVFVTHIDGARNTVVVGARAELMVTSLVVNEASYVHFAPPVGSRVSVQHRAHGEASPATVTSVSATSFEVNFESPVEAIAPGQSAVLYGDDELIGGGIIAATERVSAVA